MGKITKRSLHARLAFETTSLVSSVRGGAGPYRAVPDEQEDLLGLLGPADDVGEAGGLLRRHAVVGEAALEGGSLHT